jgi:hypothetical protein
MSLIANKRMRGRILFLSLFFVVAGILIILFLMHSQVDNSLTEEDYVYIKKFLKEDNVHPFQAGLGYTEEIRYIAAVQQAVLKRAPSRIGINHNKEREPKDVYLVQSGACYDRSRVIEKILKIAGFFTRHISVYSSAKTRSTLKTMISPGVQSHAVSEVKTEKGWLVVDSNNPWIGLDHQNNPVSISTIQDSVGNEVIRWREDLLSEMHVIFKKPFIFVYGLYSRHGKFYPPYNDIPDINYLESAYNFF